MMLPLPRATSVLERAVAARTFPGAAAEVGSSSGVLWSASVGRLTYDATAGAVGPDTVYDLASLTKVLVTTLLVARTVSDRRLALEERIAACLPGWAGADRSAVTIADLLEHCAGLPAHRPYFQALHGRAAIEPAICREPLDYPPRERSVYGDPAFMLLGFILEDRGEQPLDVQFESWRRQALPRAALCFRPPASWRSRTAPTERDPWRGRLLVGEVHDENAAALAGVAGHAGAFGTAGAVGACARWWLKALAGAPGAGIDAGVARRFVKASTVPGSSRALGWDTMLPTSSCGTRLSSSSIGHTGFTGTSVWLDPARDLYFVPLANRVHPSRRADDMQDVRRGFHDAAVLDLAT